MSEATAQVIDQEVRRLVDWGNAEATRILTERKDDLEILAQGLLEYETLSGDEIINLLKGIKPNRDENAGRTTAGPSSALPTIGKKSSGGTAPEPTLA